MNHVINKKNTTNLVISGVDPHCIYLDDSLYLDAADFSER